MPLKRRPGAGWAVQPAAAKSFRQGTFAAPRGRATFTGVRKGRMARNGTAGAELKFHDIDWDESVADLSAGVISNVSSLVFIGQGVTESTRIGRKAVIRGVGWRGKIQLKAIAGATLQEPQTVRLLLVQDSQCNGAAPTVAGTNGLLQTAEYQSFNDLTNKGRFKVLTDRTYTLNPGAAAGNGTANDSAPVDLNFTFFKALNVPIEYSGTAAPSIIDELRTNNIFGIMIASKTDATVSLDSKLRFRFSDG